MQEFKENYLNQNERMNPQLENMLKSNTTDLADNPAFPKTDANGNPINFLELIAYKRFLEVVERVKRYTNLTNVTGQAGMSILTPMLMQGVNFIEQVEQPHKLALENLAVDLVVEEMEIPDGVFQFQCKIVNRGEINQDGFQKETKEPSEEEINQTLSNEAEAENMTPSEFFEMEKHKRRFINMLIQGSSKKGHYMFELVRNKLNEYNPNLAKSYGEVMSINDLIYWLLDDETINQMASQPSAMAGKEEIEQSEDGTIIKTEAICFPVSLHEIIKGIMETFGTQGLPDDPQQANMIIDAVDSLSNETMDLRLGAIIWEKFINAYPRMVFDEGNRYLQHYLFSRFCGLETTEFFRVARMIMANDPKGTKYMERMTDEIISDLNVDEFEKNKGDNEDDINIDDLFNYKKGGQTKNKKGDIGKSGTQYGYTLKEWDKIAEKNGLLVSPTQWWKSQEGKKYKDSFGRNKTVGQHSGDKEQEMNRYGYMIANGMDLGSDKIPASAKKYVQDNNFNKFGEGGKAGEYFINFENDFSSTRRGGVKNYSVDIDLENGEQLRGGDLDFKDGNDALFLYERIKKKGEYQNEKIEDIQLLANFKNGDYESVDIPRYADGGGVEIGRTFESENDSLNTFKGYNNYFCIEFNGKVLHSVKTKSQHLKKLNELVDKYNLTEIKQKNSEFDDGGAVSDEIIIKSGNNGNLKVIYHAIKNQRTELNANEVFEQEKIKGKSVFLFVNDELYDEFIADGDENKYADGGGTYVDLFEDYENIPANVQEILDEYDLEEDSDYDTLLELQNRLETIGYTFEYGLDAVPYGLRPSSVKLNELEGYENEEYAKGGKVSAKLKKLKSEMKQIWEETGEQYSDKKEMLMSAGYNGSDANDLKHEEWKYLGNDVQIKLINDYFGYYEKLAVYVKGVGSIYNGTSMQSAVNKANSYLKNNPKAEIVISDEKYGDTYDLDGYKIDEEYAEGGEAGFDIYNYDEKMALINLGQVYEYAIKLDKIIKEDTDLEEWVKMKLTRIEQNISDVKHSLEGWEKYEDGGEIPKKQLLHIAKYSKYLIEMISNGRKLMSWQEDKLAISSASIDDIYHHLDYEMGNRAEDLDVDNEYAGGGEAGDDDVFDARKLDLDSQISSRVYYKGVDNEINKILQNNYKPVYDFDKKGIEWVYKNTLYEIQDEDLILELKEALAMRNRSVVDMIRINNELPRIESKYGKDVNFAKKMYQEAKDFYQNKLRNEKSNKANDVLIDYLISRLKENNKEFAEGGKAQEYGRGGFMSKGELVWKKLSSAEKMNFLSENFTPQITPRSQEILVGKAYNFLPKNVKIVLQSKYANVEDYAYGGEIQEWMEKALQSLIEETGNNNLQIFYVKENEFTCQDDDSEEYRVFKNEDLAYDYAVEEVESDMEYQPENFNRDFIMEYVEIDDLFVNDFEMNNYQYTKDIQSEKSEKYENKLIEELVANGLISEEEAQTRSSKELDEEYTQDYIDLLTSEQIGDDNGITHFIDNFGENDFFTLVYENNLIDVEDASKKAVEIDGIAHFLAGYDGETIYLDNNIVAYRTN